ncbi:MAG: S41 family peptidase, partial [Planctomycetota bacterium JB042]
LRRGPDGRFAFVSGLGDLVVMDEHGEGRRTIVSGWDSPDFDWSPDGKWLAYSRNDDDFNEDVWIAPVDGSRAPFNVSVHPDNDSGPAWSPDGKVLAFSGRRSDQEVDVYYVWLRASDDEEDSRDRRLEKALEKMKKERKEKSKGKKSDAPKKEDDADGGDGKDGDEDDDAKAEKKEESKQEKKGKDEVEVVIDFDGLRDRIHRISTPNSYDGGLYWIEDDKLAFYSSAGPSGRATYTVEFPDELKPKKLTSSSLSGRIRLEKAKKVGGVSDGKPAVLSGKGSLTTYAFSAKQEHDAADRNGAAFVEGWRAMRDRFYDERLNNRDWEAIRRKYEPAARTAVDADQLREVGNMMLGELNASHLGFSVFASSPRGDEPFTDVTAHLGVRFDADFEGPGWRVRDVLPGGPASERTSRLEAGEVVLSIDGTAVSAATDPTLVLNGDLARDVRLKVRDGDGEVREVTIRPISYRSARSLLYDAWLESNRRRVDEASDGALGYLHIRGMNWSSFLKFEEELYKVGYGKDGLVVDVRKNGGGSTTDHLLTALTQPVHAVTVPRGGGPGYPHDRKVYATWNKPIVVLCDQDSFSNAEIFSHAIKHLGRGTLVGAPTAGGVISTGSQRLLDRFGMVRMPFRGWYLLDTGEDMERNGCVPHHVVWPWPGELPRGEDVQLETAVRVLTEDVEEWKARPRPALRKASERDRR